jgi:hypothetical protein
MQIRVYVNTGQTGCLQHQTVPSSKQLYSVRQNKHIFPVLLDVLPSTYVLFHNTLHPVKSRLCFFCTYRLEEDMLSNRDLFILLI